MRIRIFGLSPFLIKIRGVAKAEELMKMVVKLRPASAYNEETLGGIAADQGRFEDAIINQRKALGDRAYEERSGTKANTRLKAYQDKKPIRD